MRKFVALLCTLAFAAAVGGAAMAGPGCSGSYEEQTKQTTDESASS